MSGRDEIGPESGPGDLLGEPVLAGPAPRGLGRHMAGGGDKVDRRGNDFYPTPPDVTRAFLRVELPAIDRAVAETGGGPVWEPCGRGGAILRELWAAGLSAGGTDIVADFENGVLPLDLLKVTEALGQVVVTNPPFALAADMIGVLLERLKVPYLALLLKSQFWHADERRALFRRHTPARIWALTWRPDFLGGGAPTMDCIWVVWDASHAGPTRFDVLPRAAEAQGELL